MKRLPVLTACAAQGGFTLLELLLVVAILSSLALAATTFVDNADDQERFEGTRERLEQIRFATIGDGGRTANGQPELRGFVADMGRLPGDLKELIEHPLDCNRDGTDEADGNGNGLPDDCEWRLDAVTGLWVGWHGPYLGVLADSSGVRAYRDSWGNGGAAPNYGWKFEPTDRDASTPPNDFDNTLQVQSYGSDGSTANADPGPYDEEYPSVGKLVELYDHQVNVKGWSITVSFFNPSPPEGATTAQIPTSPIPLYLRLCYPTDGAITAASPRADATLNPVNDGDTTTVTFTFPPGTDAYVPIGVRSLRVFDNVSSDCAIATNYGAANQRLLVALVPRAHLPVSVNQAWRLE
ncbi:MAG TPA: prepilin-type N-terminal cleavage/methylation domain-containing protein [Methylococcaceae bacterium]|nr:prepilin-type N-terminal cleavage/methylation domain-containing protein [Methylococcaceae bacterium]